MHYPLATHYTSVYPQSTKSVNYVEELTAKEQQILVLLNQAIHETIIV